MKSYHEPMADWLTAFDAARRLQAVRSRLRAAHGQAAGARTASPACPRTKPACASFSASAGGSTIRPRRSKLLQDAGFKKTGNGWMLPDGTPWKITINAPADFEVESQRLAFAVANEWKKFGIDVNVQQTAGGVFATEYATGNFQAGSYWNQTCAIGPDVWVRLEWWHERYVSPNGQPASFNRERYATPRSAASSTRWLKLPGRRPQERRVRHRRSCKELVKGMPLIPMFGTSKFVPVNDDLLEELSDRRQLLRRPVVVVVELQIHRRPPRAGAVMGCPFRSSVSRCAGAPPRRSKTPP